MALPALFVLGACTGQPGSLGGESPALSEPPVTGPPSAAVPIAPTPLPVVSAAPLAEGEARCQNDAQGYSVSYPADWVVFPGDPVHEIPECTYFGPGGFDVDAEDGEGDAWTVDMGIFSGACLEFFPESYPVVLMEVVVAGFPAVRSTTSDSYGYILNLRGDGGDVIVEPGDDSPPSSEECQMARGLLIAGREWGAVDGPPLQRIVDRMATTIEIRED